MELFEGTPRERNLLIGLGMLMMGFLIWLLMSGGESAPTKPVDARAQALADLQIVESALSARPAETRAERAPFDRAALIRTAQGAGLDISRLQPGENGALTVTLAPAPSASVLGFLDRLTRTTEARITALDMSAGTAPNVEARVTVAPDA